MNYKKIHDDIIELAKSRIYDATIHQKHHIIPLHEDPSSAETVPLTIREHALVHRLRYKFIGTYQNLLAYCLLRRRRHKDLLDMCSEAGKIGGVITKENKLGIFSETYDRSKQSKINYNNGVGLGSLTDKEKSKYAKKGGDTTKENKSGIFREDLQHKRSEWASVGGKEVHKQNKAGGTTSQEWREKNPEKIKKYCSDGGKFGGKIVGKMYWWNNGIINKKSNTCPGKGFVRGMLMSEKKRIQFERMKLEQKRKRENNG